MANRPTIGTEVIAVQEHQSFDYCEIDCVVIEWSAASIALPSGAPERPPCSTTQ